MDDQSAQSAQLQIVGPDEEGCVWICSSGGRAAWCENLGPKDEVAEVMAVWLASVTRDEKPTV